MKRREKVGKNKSNQRDRGCGNVAEAVGNNGRHCRGVDPLSEILVEEGKPKLSENRNGNYNRTDKTELNVLGCANFFDGLNCKFNTHEKNDE